MRTSHNLLDILSYWTETFPYDFRHRNILHQLEDILRMINRYQIETKTRTEQIHESLMTKVIFRKRMTTHLTKLFDIFQLKVVTQYEEYIREVNFRASQTYRRSTFTVMNSSISSK